MSLNDLKSEFSLAYIRAVAHAAGYFVQEANRNLDGDGVDLMLFSRGAGGVVRSPRLDLQVKATETPVVEDPFPFDLKLKNYDELRAEDWQVPRILVVVVVPSDVAHWLSASEDALTLRHCGYWTSLRGHPPTENPTKIRIHIDRSKRFDVEAVRGLMGTVRVGGLP